MSVAGERVAFDGSVAANVAAGDAFATRVRSMIDELIRRRGLEAPPAEPDEHDAHVDLDPPATLDLRAEEAGAVVWCTASPATSPGSTRPWSAPMASPGTTTRRRARARPLVPGAALAALPLLGHPARLPGDAAWVAGAVKVHLGG